MPTLFRILIILSVFTMASCQKVVTTFSLRQYPEDVSVDSGDWKYLAAVYVTRHNPSFLYAGSNTFRVTVEDTNRTIIIDQTVTYENDFPIEFVGSWIVDETLRFVVDVEVATEPFPSIVYHEYQIE